MSKVLNGRADVAPGDAGAGRATCSSEHDYVGRRIAAGSRTGAAPSVELVFDDELNAYATEIVQGMLDAATGAGVVVARRRAGASQRGGRPRSRGHGELAAAGRRGGDRRGELADDRTRHRIGPRRAAAGGHRPDRPAARPRHQRRRHQLRRRRRRQPATCSARAPSRRLRRRITHGGLQPGPHGGLSRRDGGGGRFPSRMATSRAGCSASRTASKGRRRCSRCLQPPTAVFAACDEVAAGVVEAARAHGLRVPEDLSVVGFDDTQLARYGSPPLTTVRQPLRDMGASRCGRRCGWPRARRSTRITSSWPPSWSCGGPPRRLRSPPPVVAANEPVGRPEWKGIRAGGSLGT